MIFFRDLSVRGKMEVQIEEVLMKDVAEGIMDSFQYMAD